MGGTGSNESDRGNVKEEDWPISEVPSEELPFVPRADNIEEMSDANSDAQQLQKNNDMTRIINLDVGGVRVRTTLATLKAAHEPHSFFRGMFSGNFKEGTEDKEYFIDRDGKHFQLILNWLRNPNCFAIPCDEQVYFS